MTERLTFVTVVFDAELALLRLQARSMQRWLDPDSVERIIVLDNCAVRLFGGRRSRLAAEYGSLADRVDFVRVAELVPATHVHGWRSQQAAKLLIAQQIETPHYVALDAKNHFIAPAESAVFVDENGRAHGRSHPYTNHPLRRSLERTLSYLGAPPEVVSQAMLDFPPTGTPFVFDTARVRELISDIERTSGRAFADEFERQDLLEFFLYSGWLLARGPGLDIAVDGIPVEAPTVWPSAAKVDGVDEAARKAAGNQATVFGVHRRALRRADDATQQALAAFWVSHGLFADQAAAQRFIRRFRLQFVPAMGLARGSERAHQLWRSLPGRRSRH